MSKLEAPQLTGSIDGKPVVLTEAHHDRQSQPGNSPATLIIEEKDTYGRRQVALQGPRIDVGSKIPDHEGMVAQPVSEYLLGAVKVAGKEIGRVVSGSIITARTTAKEVFSAKAAARRPRS